jgi:hypothetical protein
MVSETGLGVLQVVNAVAKGLVEQKTKSGLIDSIVGSANHDASEEELSGIKTAMQRNYSKADLHTLSNHIMDANNFLTFSKEKGAGYKIPNSPWFISTHQTSTSGITDSQRRMNTYTTSMAQVNELMANSQNAGVPMDMTTAIRKVYQGLGYIKQTEWREAVHGTGQEAKIDQVKMRLLEENFGYIQRQTGPSGNPEDVHMIVTTDGYNALLKLKYGKGSNTEERIRHIKETKSYGEILRILKENPESPVVDQYYSLLAQAIEGSVKDEDDRTPPENTAMKIVTEVDDASITSILAKAADNSLSGLFTSSQEATDLPAIRSINNAIRRVSGGLNQTVDAVYGNAEGQLKLEDKLKHYAKGILSANTEATNVLLSKPELREPYLDYIYSSLLQVYREQRYEQSITGQILGSDDKDAQNQRLEKLHRRY